MSEFAFAVDSSAVRDGNIALAVGNVGLQDHEAVVARIDEDVKLDELVPAIAETADGVTPAGVEEIVAFGAYEPGETANVVFAEPLAPGRYAVLCFFPDVNDPEHRVGPAPAPAAATRSRFCIHIVHNLDVVAGPSWTRRHNHAATRR